MPSRSPFSIVRSSSTASTAYKAAQPLAASSEHCSDDEIHIRLVPHVTYNSQCYVFDVIERSLQQGAVLKFGRYNNTRQPNTNRLSFKSKVVSRSHAELWSEDGKVLIRDTGSSSGTFVNRMRLSSVEEDDGSTRQLCDGDIIQLGVDYQHGVEPMFRAVRMRLQITHVHHNNSTNSGHRHNNHSHHELENDRNKLPSFSKTAFQQLCCRITANKPTQQQQPKDRGDIQECCICLYAIAPAQALFVAPCSHIFHYKCLRPLIKQNFPAFSCPLCRTYSDLDAEVQVEVDDLLEEAIEPPSPSSSSSTFEAGPSISTKPFVGSPPFIKQMLSSSANGLRTIMT